MKYGEIDSGAWRVSSAYDNADRPAPIAMASARSRRRRHHARNATRGCSVGSRLGIQRKPSRNSTIVTTSTASCVSARSGAENQAKVMHSTRPTTPSNVRAARRWNLACQAAATAAAAPTLHSSTKSSVAGTRARSPQVSGTISAEATPVRPAITTIINSCGCSRRVLNRRSSRRASSDSAASPAWNRRWPSSAVSSGALRLRRRRKAAAKRR